MDEGKILVWGLVILVVLAGIFSSPGKCSICSVPLKRKKYVWKVEGKKLKLCPKCNNQMERKVSKEAFKGRFG